MNFHLGEGGYGVEPVYAKQGTTYNIATPKRAGYDFLGWVKSNDNGDYLDDSGNTITETQARNTAHSWSSRVVPIGDTHYRAVWQPQHAKFSVVYWSENAADNGYSVIASKDITQIVVENTPTEVKADMTITPDTVVKNAAGNNMALKNFFSYNLNSVDPNNANNTDTEKYDSSGNRIDFNDISKGVSEEYSGNGKLFELNDSSNMPSGSIYITDTSKTVAGDGTTKLNIFFKRRPITLKFFYARRKLVNNQPTGAIDLTNSTKGFSNQSYSGMNYMSAVSRGTWQSDIADTLPTLKLEYVQAGYISELYEDYNGYRYYYYQVESKYNAPLKNKWFVDSVNPVHKKGYASEQMCIQGSWAVENGTNYYNSHTTVKNYTIKGVYEKLGIELMFATRTTDYTELHYLVSWTNTSRTGNWNDGINRVLKFKYKNYVELTNYEKNELRTYFSMAEDAPDRNIPSSRVFDPTKNDYIKEPGTGKYIDLEIVDKNYLVDGDNALYSEIVKFNSSDDPNAQPKLYGLKTTFVEVDTQFEQLDSVYDVETVDSGDQYDRSKPEAVRTANVRTNQTPADLTGFQIENFRLNPSTQQIVLDPTNTTVDWSEDQENDRRATIRFFYRRRTYNLSFHNGSSFAGENFEVPYGEYVNYTTAPQRLIIPTYYNEDLKDYYSFKGWYFDPIFSASEATAGFPMPADDTALYARWDPVNKDVSFYNDFSAYSDPDADPVNACVVPYNTKIITSEIPVDDENAEHKLTPKPSGARFAGWYYVDKEGKSVRFDPENLPVTRDLKLYAEWESVHTARYRIRYVEKGTDNEVADPDTGTLFVSKTKTFTAKSGDKYNAAHQWTEGQPNWWPVISSHSILIEENDEGEEYEPNDFTFEYFQKSTPVYYSVQYLDAETNKAIDGASAQTHSTFNAAVTETAPYIEGYVADSVTKSLVLAASENTDSEKAQEEEIKNNVIIFFYSKSDTSAIYQVNHYIQNVDDDGYELYNSETLYGTKNESVSLSSIQSGEIAASLTGSGFSFESSLATVSVNGATPVSIRESVTLSGVPTEISVYYNRSSYAYIVRYIDYENDNNELGSVTYTGADKRRLGSVVDIDAPLTFTPAGQSYSYTRISDHQLTLTIRHDDTDNPSINILNVYYKKDNERELRYQVVCDVETSDRYAALSQSSEIVTQSSEIKGSTVLPLVLDDHEYEFLGWFSSRAADEAHRLTNAVTDHYQPAALPGADMTYYAVFRQKSVSANVEIRYNDSGVYTNDEGAAVDSDGSVTGCTVEFTSPDDYVNNTQTALDKTASFSFKTAKADDKVYKYEFAGWYEIENGAATVVENVGAGEIVSAPATASCRYIAMFKKRASLSYNIKYRFTTRANGVQTFTAKGTLSGSELENALDSGKACCELTDEYILGNAPYESNHGETLSWSNRNITKSSSDENETVSAVIVAEQNIKPVHVNYKLFPNESFTAIETTIGANRETDSNLAVLNAEGKVYDGKEFSYWEIKKSAEGDTVAKCYDAWFTFCVMDDYWITPVYDGVKNAEDEADYNDIKLTFLDHSRNRWTDEEGVVNSNGSTDLLYTDFEIAFNNLHKQLYGNNTSYRTGVVFELCAKMPDDKNFDPDRDYGFESNEANLKAAILNGNVSKYEYTSGKQRSIQFSNIPTANLSNKNRVEFGKGYKNTGSNKSYVLKATAYLVENNSDVTLSNSVYICLKEEAAKDLAFNSISGS